MRIERCHPERPAKGWYGTLAGQDLPFIGYANQGISEPHRHARSHEVYLVAQGSSTVLVAGERITLSAGDVSVVGPGEVRTFLDRTRDYFHFVLQSPAVGNDKVPVA